MIALRGLQKIAGQQVVLDIDVLNIPAGHIAALVGPVGSGLDDLQQLLIGQTRPSAGTIRLDGVDPAADRATFSRQVGVLFADDVLYERQSVQENLRFFARLHALPETRIRDVLEQSGLRDKARVKAGALSTSMARRLAFGRTILHQPPILLLFEPFTRCDNPTVSLLADVVRQFAADEAAILILAADTTYLDDLCDTIYRVSDGRIVESYQPADEQRDALPFMIPAKGDDTVILLHPVDILYAVAQGDTAAVQTITDLLPTQFTLSDLESKLSRSGFFRAHRSYLVNLQHVKEIIPYTRNSYSLKLRDPDETQIPLSKSAAKELRDLLGY